MRTPSVISRKIFPTGWKIPEGNKLHDCFAEKEVEKSKNEDPHFPTLLNSSSGKVIWYDNC